MRGRQRGSLRGGFLPEPMNEAKGTVITVPAPYGGWNGNGNLSNMPATDAVVMDNAFPGLVDVSMRKGSVSWATGFPANVRNLMPYEGPATQKLFAATATAVYDVTAQGAIGAAAISGLNSAAWSYTNFANAGGNFLVMVNGADDMRVFNGTTWTAINGASTPALTGVATSNFSYVTLHQKRLWFVENGTMNLWYLGTDAFAGAATKFPCGGLFSEGGKVVAIATWTVDGGQGSDDYFVILTSRGQIAVYAGTDPASSTTWQLVGVYRTGTPIGQRPMMKFGGDLALLTTNGVYPMSKFLQSTVIDRSSTLDVKIQGAFLDFLEAYRANPGWDMQVYTPGNFLLVNVPAAVDGKTYQCVMNLTTKAWCRFTGWSAMTFAQLGDNLYFAGGREVCQGWVGTSDKGAPIIAEIVSAYNPFKYGGQKQVSLVRPHLTLNGSATINYSMDTDFKSYGGYSQITYLNNGTGGVWDIGIWDSSTWVGSSMTEMPNWLTCPDELGFLHAFRLQMLSSSTSVAWTATNFLYIPGGVL